MTATRILNGLERSTATGDEADSMARLGFLEWAFGLECDATPGAARAALASAAAQRADSDAARAFVAFLNEAAQPIAQRLVRRARNRTLH